MTRDVKDRFKGIQVAERTVSEAWTGQQLLAESQAGAVVGACARVRERAAVRVRAAQAERQNAARR